MLDPQEHTKEQRVKETGKQRHAWTMMSSSVFNGGIKCPCQHSKCKHVTRYRKEAVGIQHHAEPATPYGKSSKLEVVDGRTILVKADAWNFVDLGNIHKLSSGQLCDHDIEIVEDLAHEQEALLKVRH